MRPHAKACTSLGQLRYFSCIQYCDGVVGNSSRCLAEVPSFKKGTVNIGDWQKGRLKAESVIDCEPTKKGIASSLRKLFSEQFKALISFAQNPYEKASSAEAVVGTLSPVDPTFFSHKKSWFSV